jgi:hypothetical protein
VPNKVDVSTITTNTRVDAKANYQVDVDFKPPKIGGHDYFKMVIVEKDGDYNEETIIEKPKENYDGKYDARFAELMPSTVYMLKIHTYVGDQESVSDWFEFRTDRAVPPRNLRRIFPKSGKIDSDDVTIEFDGAPGAAGYQVEIFFVKHGQSPSISELPVYKNLLEASETSVTIGLQQGLEPGNHYKINIASISNDQIGTTSKDLDFFTRPAAARNLQVTFGIISIQVSFEPASGGMEYYDVTIAPVSNPESILDVRQLAKNDHFVFTLKSNLFEPGEEYIVTVTTFYGSDGQNSVSETGRMKPVPKPIIIASKVDSKSQLLCSWKINEKMQEEPTYNVKIFASSDPTYIVEEFSTDNKQFRRQNFDYTRAYTLQVQSKLRGILSPWVTKAIRSDRIQAEPEKSDSIKSPSGIPG